MREATMERDLVLRADAGAVATLTLNDPGRLNALSEAMLGTLRATLDAIAGETAIRVVVIRGAGRAFCAGHDLREMTEARQAPDGGRARFASLFGQAAALMLAITRLPQPVVAQVHGIATAAGCQLVASCDLAVAAEGTRFGVNGVNIGLFCSTPMVALTRNIPLKHAFHMLSTGEFVEAAEARRLGLVNRVVAAQDLEAETAALAATLAAKLGPVLRLGKRTFYEQAEMGLEAAYAHAGRVMTENMLRPDTAEGIAAFLGKRAPEWEQ